MSCSWPRVMSPRPGSSTLMTSAPSQARICVHDGPAWTCVMSRTLTPSSALRTCCPSACVEPLTLIGSPSLVHRLVHRPRSVLVGVDPHVDQSDFARGHRLASAFEGGTDLLGIAHRFAVTAEHLRELLEVDV